MGAPDNTLGALLLGVVISAILYGVTCAQTWYYFSQYRSDPWYTKLSVVVILVSDTVHQALITHTVYTYLVTDFGIVGILVWSLSVEVLFNGITAVVVQCFFIMRVYSISNKNIITTVSVLSLVICEFVVIVVYVAKAIKLTTFAEVTKIRPLSMSVNALAASCDVVITTILCTLLQHSRTGFQISDTIINKLIMFSISTGLLTSVCAVMSLVSIVVWPDAFIYVAFFFFLGRLHCNCLLAALNVRKIIRSNSRDEDMSLSL